YEQSTLTKTGEIAFDKKPYDVLFDGKSNLFIVTAGKDDGLGKKDSLLLVDKDSKGILKEFLFTKNIASTSCDGNRALVCTENGDLYTVDLANQVINKLTALNTKVSGCVIVGDSAYITDNTNGKLNVVDIVGGTVTDVLDIGNKTNQVSRSSTSIAVSYKDGIKLYEAYSLKVNSVEPEKITAGSGAVNLSVTGIGFTAGSNVLINNEALSTSYVYDNKLTAVLGTNYTETAGALNLSVINADELISNIVSLNIVNPVPSITTAEPSQAIAGSNDLVVEITGSGFLPQTQLFYNGNAKEVSYVSTSRLSVTLLATELSTVGSYNMYAFNQAPEGGKSNEVSFSVVYPTPVISSISPVGAITGATNTPLTIEGSGFVAGANIYFNNVMLTIDELTGSSIKTTIPASMLQTVGTYPVQVVNPTPGGGASNSVFFTVSNLTPIITYLKPSYAVAGSLDKEITISGFSFADGASVYFGNTALSVSSVTSTSIKVTINYSLLQQPGTYKLKVVNPAPGLETSNEATFNVSESVSMNIDITYPSNGAALNDQYIVVKGTYATGAQNFAINVDNIPVYISGNQWVSPEFKLDKGANNITATISDGQGNTHTMSVGVNVSLPTNGIQLRARKGNGLSPLKAYFDVDEKLLYSAVLYEIDFDGDGTYDYSGSELTDPSYTYTTPGIYYPKATVTDEQGNKYTDSTLIAVLNRVEVDTELKNRWQTMKNALAIKDISSALQYFTSDYQPLYGKVFAALLDNLPQYAAGMRDINLMYCENDSAKFHIEKQEVIAGEVHNISYFIYFVRDIDGFWKIYRF
ncbi:MAG: hypothetical protein L3V56_13920, partial [Candidatus Magnetoovum sp. WYHC-5]|nr:hypothetical protein [Candidatus Magnetoovum sp. WYHC-5]